MDKVLTLTLAVICTTFGVSAWYYCHGDLCDEKTEFCSADFRKCRPCREVLDDCLTNRLPKNCTRVCIQDKFEEQMKKERERKCAEPKPLLNGYHNGSHKALYDQGDVISVSCNPGFRLAGNNTITCKGFGEWSNDLPICEEITCPYPSLIRNGFWSSRNPNVTHVAGDKIEAVCDQGYLINGTAIWNCSNDGNWISSDSYFPLCHLPGETEAGIVPALVFCLVVSGAHGNNNKFPCYGDRCNRGNTDQFCSSTFRYCRDCADVVESCGTADQPLNCMSFCADHLAELKLKDKRGNSMSR